MYRKLRGKIVTKYGTIKAFSEAIGMTATAASLKLTGKTTFDTTTIKRWCIALDIPVEDAGLYFFDSELNEV